MLLPFYLPHFNTKKDKRPLSFLQAKAGPFVLTFKLLVIGTQTVFPVEFLNTSASLRRLLLSGIERMALGADLNVDLRLRGTGNEFVAAVASYLALIVLGLNALLHDFHL